MTTAVRLAPLEARVIGCLIEKEITTPDQYPLSLNALTNACNQKSNRDPVLELRDADVQNTLDELAKRHLVLAQSGFGSRVDKFQHRFCNTEFGSLKFTPQELAIVCELLLRGPQMPGELRSRANRLAPFRDVGELEGVLEQLATRADGPFVAKLEREPGRRESRYIHCFDAHAMASAVSAAMDASAASIAPAFARAVTASAPRDAHADRLSALESEVRALGDELTALKRALGVAD